MKTKLNPTTFIDVGNIDKSRPASRPPKTNWKVELLKKGVQVLQHVSPRTASEIVWSQFTYPGKVAFTEKQQQLIAKAHKSSISYLGHEIVTYRWGSEGPKILLSHGWRSKIADFRALIETLIAAGFVVEGLDWKAHGNSGGSRTALPEMRDILKNFYVQNAPYHAVVGYSIGGLAAGITLSEISKDLLPKKTILIAAPPFIRYFFKEIISDLGFSHKVYEEMCGLVGKNYHEPIDYFDIRSKARHFEDHELHLIYDETDETIPFERGLEMQETFPFAKFVHTKGLGHYKIISHQEILTYLQKNLMMEVGSNS